jgi:hypothetical protein
MRGLDGLLVEEGDAERVVFAVFGMFKVGDREFGVVNYVYCQYSCGSLRVRSLAIVVFRSSLTGVNKGRLLAETSPELETFQGPR